MSSLTIFQRLNLMLLLTLALVAAAVGLALWVQGARTGAALQQAQVTALHDRVGRDLLVMMDSLRMISADPRNESERTRRAQAEDDLRKKLRDGQQANSDYPELVSSLKAIGEFAFGNAPATLGYLQSRVLEVPESNTADVSTVFNSNYREVARQRELLLSDVGQQVAAVRNALLLDSQRNTLLGLGTAGVVLVAGLVLGRLQARAITEPLKRLASTVEQLRQGDLTKRASLAKDGLGSLGQEVDRFVDDLSQAVEQIQRCGVQLNSGASQMAATTKDQQTGFSEAAATLEQVNAAAGQIFSTSNNLVKSMQEVNTAAEQTASLAGSGQTVIARTEATVRNVLDGSSEVGAKLAALSDKTANINSVVATIAKIADQTNLLSLNAAIEAEKAGEYGLGFAVVAVEIRRLADQTAVATYDIEKTVKEMQSAVAAGVIGMEKFSEELRRGAEEVREVSAHLGQIIERVQLVMPRFQAIHGSMQSQLSDATQINERLTQLAQTVQRTGESLRNSKAALEQLQAAGAGLRASTSRFKLTAAAAAPAALPSGGVM